jgi:O-acetyl-ADP-ribose deacetylase (regulator of RNase III)
LALAYRTSLELAASHDCRSIALPALSTGAYRYPIDAAARIAIQMASEFLAQLTDDQPLVLVRFVLFSIDVLKVFEAALQQR